MPIFSRKLQGFGEFLWRDARHFQRTPQRAKRHFPVHRDDTPSFASVPETMGSLAMR